MTARTCWRIEIEFETGVRSNYQPDAEAIRTWVMHAFECSTGPIVHPSNVQILSLISPKLKPKPPPLSTTIKRKLRP